MRLQRWLQRSIPMAAVVLVGAAPMLLAQGQEIFQWSGRVDREVQISMRGNELWTRGIGSNDYSGRGESRVFTPMPRQDGLVVAQVMSGRGTADVIQQPSAENNYTTVVRVRDGQSGASNYHIAAYWQPYANGEVVGRKRGRHNGGYGNGAYENGGYGNGGYGNRGNANGSMFHWSGNVDGQLEIRIQNGRVDYRTLSGQQPTGVRSNLGNTTMSRGASGVGVSQNQGRGTVTVMQQPAAYNGYTTVIRVSDPQGGYGHYDFDLYWR